MLIILVPSLFLVQSFRTKTTAVATARLSKSLCPSIGIFTIASHNARAALQTHPLAAHHSTQSHPGKERRGNPVGAPDVPTTCAAAGFSTRRTHPGCRAQSLVQITPPCWRARPRDHKGRWNGPAGSPPAHRTASLVRRIVPRLPGSATESSATQGLPTSIGSQARPVWSTTAAMPCGPSLSEIRSNTSR